MGDGCIGRAEPLAVVQVVHGVVFRDAEVAGGLHGVDIRTKEKELPALLLLDLNEFAHLVAGEQGGPPRPLSLDPCPILWLC